MNQASVFWFTGLSGAGKTTIATAVQTLLKGKRYRVLVIDGDDVRNRLHTDLGFSEQDIKKNNLLIIELCLKNRAAYEAIFVSIISPYTESREQARLAMSPRFYEIYFSADISIVSKRDVKGLYAKAMRNEIDNMIGFTPGYSYEAPICADFEVDSGIDGIEKSVIAFNDFVIICLRNCDEN